MENDVNKAIDESIAKWEEKYAILLEAKNQNKATPYVKLGVEFCPLCKMFLVENGYCEECPISNKVDDDYCYGSPYRKAADLWDNYHEAEQIPTDELLQAFKDEIDFLKSLERKAA